MSNITKNNPFDQYEKLGEQEVRKRLAEGRLGDPGSLNYERASSWLQGKEAEIRDDREKKILLWCIVSAVVASIAAILAFIGILH